LGLLGNLHGNFVNNFEPVIEKASTRRSNVVIFANYADFKAYAHKMAPDLQDASGFYSPLEDQLVVYNFFSGGDYKAADGILKSKENEIDGLRNGSREYDQVAVNEYEQRVVTTRSQIGLDTRATNMEVLRHEAGHQLSYDLGLVKGDNFDLWLLEGIAEYCSVPYMGEMKRSSLETMREALQKRNNLSIKSLFEYTEGRKFYSQNPELTKLLYAESGLMFFYLMSQQRRDKFFVYIQGLKKAQRLSKDERMKLFEDSLGMPMDQLEKQFVDFIKQS
jgi:hypothetical protein